MNITNRSIVDLFKMTPGMRHLASVVPFNKPETFQIAKLYAPILEQNALDNQLDWVIKEVFKKHVKKDPALLTSGVALEIKEKKFYAKVEGRRVFILTPDFKVLGDGKYTEVLEIYDIASRQFLAVKKAKLVGNAKPCIDREVNVLKSLHALADFDDFSLEGLQSLPMTTFSLPYFHAFLTMNEGIDLAEWYNHDHSNLERLELCKAIAKAFASKVKAGYWHGDIKPENIMIKDGIPKIIDWEGAILLEEAVKAFKFPGRMTCSYISLNDYSSADSLIEKFEEEGESANLRAEFLQAANETELFTLAVVLFCTLVSREPFDRRWSDEYEASFYWTESGIDPISMEQFCLRNYSDRVVKTITTMLAHNPKDRFTTDDALFILEHIT